jgi:hypothetical protein
MGKAQKPDKSECYTPLSEPFRTNFKSVLQKFEIHRFSASTACLFVRNSAPEITVYGAPGLHTT